MRSNGLLCGALIVLVSVAACSKEPAAPTQAAMSPPPSEAPPTPPPPDRNQQLKDQLSELGASHSDEGWVVSLPSAHFKAGETTFEPADTARVDRIATLLKDRSDVHVLVQAFTDSRGSTARNLQLSQQRADSVERALIDRGVEASRIRAEGRGEEQPIATNDTATGRERNRRVQITFSDAEGHFAGANAPADTG
jgi:outer membrane protein OmpA-like peptidoglycan-associated protein